MDVPAESAEVHALSIQMQNTTKPLWMHAFSLEAVPFMFELMVARMGSVEALREQSVAIINSGHRVAVHHEGDGRRGDHPGVPSRRAASRPTGTSCPGFVSPMTVAGSVVQNCAEVLAHVILCQVVKPGHPAMMTQFNVPGDMATGFSTLATPAANVQRSAGVQLCKEGFGIPVSGCPIMTDTYVSDGRAVAEKALGGLMSIMAGMDIAYGVGRLGGASLASPAQLVIDNQLIALLKEYVGGVHVDDEYLAVDEIVAAGIGGSFVHEQAHAAPLPRLRGAQPLPLPAAADSGRPRARRTSTSAPSTSTGGCKTQIKPVDLPDDVRRDMDAVVARADKALSVTT